MTEQAADHGRQPVTRAMTGHREATRHIKH